MNFTFVEGWQVSPITTKQPNGTSALLWAVERIDHITGEAWRVLPPFNSRRGAMTIARMMNRGEQHSLTIVPIKE